MSELERRRAWWFDRQGLSGQLRGAKPAEVLSATGWARSVGGANPYFTLFSRADVRREEADQAVASLEIHELPCARGCTFVVPQEHFALALKVGTGFGEISDMNVARKFLGVTDAEIDHLCERVLDSLSSGPLLPAEMKAVLGDAARSLGPEGKKRGQSTTLPLALGRLQAAGEIRRKPVGGRLDQQRYAYVGWADCPLASYSLTREEAMTELGRLYFRWIGPASLSHFQWFSGLGVKAAKEALAPLELVALSDAPELLLLPDVVEEYMTFRAPTIPKYALIAGTDGLLLHRREVVPLLDPADYVRKMQGDKAVYELGGIQELTNHAIIDRGRVIGLWEFDPEEQEIVWQSFVPADDALRAEVARTEAFTREQLGDARSFSLDSPESRKPKIAALRTGG